MAKDLIFKSAVKRDYGLTDSWVAKLGKPDLKVPNPHHPDGADASLYSVERVEKFINQHAEEYLELSRKAGKAIKAEAANKQVARTLNWAMSVEIEISGIPAMGLLKKEVGDYYKGRTGDFTKSRNAFIDYVRHTYSNYDKLLDELVDRPGRNDGEKVLKDRCNEMIVELLEVLNVEVKFGIDIDGVFLV